MPHAHEGLAHHDIYRHMRRCLFQVIQQLLALHRPELRVGIPVVPVSRLYQGSLKALPQSVFRRS